MSVHAPHLLSRSPRRTSRPSELGFAEGLTLARGRLHEACGPARHTLALLVARAAGETLLWIAPDWAPETLCADGVQAFLEPARLLFVRPRRREDLLWCMEEALRSAAAPLVVADLPAPPGLTQVRRLHLAAEAGAAGGDAPTGLILTPSGEGAPGVETRWALASRHAEDASIWHLDRLRARAAPPKTWHLAGAPCPAVTAAASP